MICRPPMKVCVKLRSPIIKWGRYVRYNKSVSLWITLKTNLLKILFIDSQFFTGVQQQFNFMDASQVPH